MSKTDHHVTVQPLSRLHRLENTQWAKDFKSDSPTETYRMALNLALDPALRVSIYPDDSAGVEQYVVDAVYPCPGFWLHAAATQEECAQVCRDMGWFFYDESDRPSSEWIPWEKASRFMEKDVLVKFENGHVEDAVIKPDHQGDPSYLLFDGDTLTTKPIVLTMKPRASDSRFLPWSKASEYIDRKVLLMFESRHMEIVTIHENADGRAFYRLHNDREMFLKDQPVSFMLTGFGNLEAPE